MLAILVQESVENVQESVQNVKRALNLLGSLITVFFTIVRLITWIMTQFNLLFSIQLGDDGCLRMVHKSLKDFLFGQSLSCDLYASFVAEQTMLAHRCLELLDSEQTVLAQRCLELFDSKLNKNGIIYPVFYY